MIKFAKNQELFEKFSSLIKEQKLPEQSVMKWARFLSVAEEEQLKAIIKAMEIDSIMIAVLTQNLDDKLKLVDENASEEKWNELFNKEREYLKLND